MLCLEFKVHVDSNAECTWKYWAEELRKSAVKQKEDLHGLLVFFTWCAAAGFDDLAFIFLLGTLKKTATDVTRSPI